MKKLAIALLVLVAAACQAQFPPTSPCAQTQNLATASLTTTAQILAVPTNIVNQRIVLCSVTLQVAQGGSPVTFGLSSGTGINCGTGNALVTPQYSGVLGTTQLVTENYPGGLPLPRATNLCWQASAAPTGAVVHVTYAFAY